MSELDRLSRDDLIERARRLGVERPEVMTRLELKDELLRRSVEDREQRSKARGWLGVARDLLARLVEQGLHLPDAAKLIRGEATLRQPPSPPPVASVTLAEIYAAQGHVQRALETLDEVLAREPDHPAARALRERLDARPGASPAAAEAPHDDLLLVVPRAPGVVDARWTIAAALLEKLRAEGEPVVRVVAYDPDWRGARRSEHDLPVTGPHGAVTLEGLSGRESVRAALGARGASGFRARLVAVVAAEGAVQWAPTRRARRLAAGPEGRRLMALARR
jgi:hypothetical protein